MTVILKLRDRDAVITKENIIFRVYGYNHPPNEYVCDPEYAPQTIYKTTMPRAFRKNPNKKQIFYKFYADQGLRFIQKKYPKYTINYAPLRTRLVGVKKEHIKTTRKPQQKFQQLVTSPPKDALIKDLQALYNILKSRTTLSKRDFGVFGSLLHGFYHPDHSDLDLTIHGRKKLETLQQVLQQIYTEKDAHLENEFENEEAIKNKNWHFINYTLKEYVWHQQRKLVYALFKGEKRRIKTEFEPVKNWQEIQNEYSPKQQITKEGWIKVQARIIDDKEAPFMPSIYKIEPLQIISETKPPLDLIRILSYVEEFRMQAKKDETVIVEGNLEKVATPKNCFHQITLTYGPRYYEQVLKVIKQAT